MKHIIWIIIAATLLACASLRVETKFDPKADFKQYKTWCWLECDLIYQGPAYLYDSTLIDNIANAIAREMQAKGYVQGDENSDIMVDFHLIFKEDSTYFATVNMHDESLTFWTPYHEEFFHYINGSLIIDVVDREKSLIIWRSNAKRLLSYTEKLTNEEVSKGIKKAMREFPPENQ